MHRQQTQTRGPSEDEGCLHPECLRFTEVRPLSSEYGTHETVKARFWPWLSGGSPRNLSSRSRKVSSEYGTHKTIKARFWPWLSGESPKNASSCSLFARKRHSNTQKKKRCEKFRREISFVTDDRKHRGHLVLLSVKVLSD